MSDRESMLMARLLTEENRSKVAESSLSKALARVAELEGEWDVGFTEGLRAMRERAAKLVEQAIKQGLPVQVSATLAQNIRALPLSGEKE